MVSSENASGIVKAKKGEPLEVNLRKIKKISFPFPNLA
jgi:hypothetical protein